MTAENNLLLLLSILWCLLRANQIIKRIAHSHCLSRSSTPSGCERVVFRVTCAMSRDAYPCYIYIWSVKMSTVRTVFNFDYSLYQPLWTWQHCTQPPLLISLHISTTIEWNTFFFIYPSIVHEKDLFFLVVPNDGGGEFGTGVPCRQAVPFLVSLLTSFPYCALISVTFYYPFETVIK